MENNIDKMSKPNIEKLLNHPLSDESYAQVVAEVLFDLLETNDYE